MGAFDLQSKGFAVGLAKPANEPIVIGLFGENDFALVGPQMGELGQPPNYADWLDLREGEQIALSFAGVNAVGVFVGARPFLRWCALGKSPPNETSLDRFAALAWRIANARDVAVFAEVSDPDFSMHSQDVQAFRVAGSLREWQRRRGAAQTHARQAGLCTETMPICIDAFAKWCDCVGLEATETALDRYTYLLAEDLVADAIAAPINQIS